MVSESPHTDPDPARHITDGGGAGAFTLVRSAFQPEPSAALIETVALAAGGGGIVPAAEIRMERARSSDAGTLSAFATPLTELASLVRSYGGAGRTAVPREGEHLPSSASFPPGRDRALAPAPRSLSSWLAFAAGFTFAVLAATRAHAVEGEDVFNYAVGGGISYDNNLLRLPGGVDPSAVGVGDRPRGTWFGNAYARATMDAPISRQRIRAYAQANAYRYDDYSYLNWQGVDFGASWLWEVGNRWNGTLSYDHLRFLSGLTDFRALVQNLRTVQTARATAEYWLHPRWRLTGGYTGTFITNSGDIIATTDVNTNAFGAGFKFVSTQQNYIIFGARYTDGDYPNREQPTIVGDTGFTQHDAGVDFSWGLGGKAELLGNVAYTERDFPNLSQRDFSGPTGNVRFNWRATGSTGFNAAVRREIGGIEDVTANYILTTSASIAPYWLITPRIQLGAFYQYQIRDYRGAPGVAIGLVEEREDRYNYAGLNATWSPTRNWQLGLGVMYSNRDSNVPNNNFDDVTTTATVRFGF
jgi:exopolysaccharide biosynthesis operon protein EpsL